jgi:hypothetical protein
MYSSVVDVTPGDGYQLTLVFSNGEERILDLSPYLNLGIFTELKNIDLFRTVKVSFDTIRWDNQADLDPEWLYRNSRLLPETGA